VSDPRTQPVRLDFERTKHLKIRWADGHESVIPLQRLREACPCAVCQAEHAEDAKEVGMAGEGKTHDPERVTVAKADLVGNYAVQIRWEDGHDAGIYDFALLRSLG
jgi:DUF971 family protein